MLDRNDIALDATDAKETPGAVRETRVPPVFATGSKVEPSPDPGLQDTAASPLQLIAGRYLIQEQLGAGAFGAVYRVYDRVSRDEIALKVIPIADAEQAERVRRELRSARQVTHPCVVRLHDMSEDGQRLVLGMELIRGVPLDAWIAGHPNPDLEEVLRMSRDVCAGVAAAHAAGIVHRDLKPANILRRDQDGSCVVVDFGIARPSDPSAALGATRGGAAIGTPLYMAPEQLAGSASVGPAADVYALGLILYELATGARVHDADSYAGLAIARSADVQREDLRRTVPEPLASVILRCLKFTAGDRYASAEELAEALAGIELAEPQRIRESTPCPRPRLPRRWVAIAAAVLALAVGTWRLGVFGLPAPDAPLRVALVPVDAEDEDWLRAAAVQLFRDYLQAWATDYQIVSPGAAPDLWLDVVAVPSAEGVVVDLRIGEDRNSLRSFTRREASSLFEASDHAGTALRDHFQELGAPRSAHPDEARAMQDVAAPSLAAFLRYRYALQTSARDYLDTLVAEHPRWAHARAAQAFFAVEAQEGIPEHGVEVDADGDPVGARLLALLGHPRIATEPAITSAELQPSTCAASDDLCHMVRLRFAGLPDDELLIEAKRLCGVSMADDRACEQVPPILARSGLHETVTAFYDDWLARQPTSSTAIVMRAAHRLRQGDTRAAAEAAVWLRRLEPRLTLGSQSALLIAAGDFDGAAKAALELSEDPASASQGRYLLATALTAKGSFAQALSLLGRPDGFYREQMYEARIDLEAGLGLDADAVRTIDEWLSSSAPPPPLAARVRSFQRDLLQRRISGSPCPDLEATVATVEDESLRPLVAQVLRRLAAAEGCAPCKAVVADGTSGFHRTSSNVAFAVCAMAEGEDRLAESVLEAASLQLMPNLEPGGLPSPFSANLARYHLAEVYARQGKDDDARRVVDEFLGRWDSADRPLPVIERARALRQRLR